MTGERLATAAAFLAPGLARGERCLRVASEPGIDRLLGELAARGLDVGGCTLTAVLPEDLPGVTSRKPDDIPARNCAMQKLFARSLEELKQEAGEEGNDTPPAWRCSCGWKPSPAVRRTR